jgi:mitochondrial fission protein ELM1
VSTVIWQFLDAKPGHQIQSRGLVQALQERIPVSVCELPVNEFGGAFRSWLGGRYRPGEQLPAPDLLLGAGHATHWHLLAARRHRGGRIIVIMQPSLPLRCFDLCLIPEHDSPPQAANVLPTCGVLNTVRPGHSHEPDRGVIVLGGPSRHFKWNNEQILARIEGLVSARPLKHWLMTSSPRTPESLVRRLIEQDDFEFMPYPSATGGWLQARLAEAGEVWVSEDSVSMIYEALSSGARVGLLPVQRDGSSRVSAGVDALVARRWVAAPGSLQLAAGPPEPLNEAARCAEWITERWLNS